MESCCIHLTWLDRKRPTLRACFHGGGGPQMGEVKCGMSPHLSCKLDQIKMRDHMENLGYHT